MKKAKKKVKKYHLVVYVEDCGSKMKKFKEEKDLAKFVKEFLVRYPNYMSHDSDNWIDYVITDISGDVTFFTESMEIK